MMDTLRLAHRLKEAGFETPQAEGMARALGDELTERVVTKSDLDDAIQPIHARLDTMEAKFDGKFDATEARFDAMEDKFDAKFDAMDVKFDAVEGKFDAVEGKFDAVEGRFDAVDAKIDSVHRELTGKFNTLLAVMALGFTLLVGLGGYNAIAPRLAAPFEQAASAPEAGHTAAATRASFHPHVRRESGV